MASSFPISQFDPLVWADGADRAFRRGRASLARTQDEVALDPFDKDEDAASGGGLIVHLVAVCELGLEDPPWTWTDTFDQRGRAGL